MEEKPDNGEIIKQKVPEKCELNIDSLDQSLWLVKIPQFVAEKWANGKNDDIVGSLKISLKQNAIGGSTKQLSVKLNTTDDDQIPEDFTLDEVNKGGKNDNNFIAFSVKESGKESFSIDGNITKSLLLKPQGTKEYRQLIRNRGISKLMSRRETTVADTSVVQKTAMQSHAVDFITSDRIELKRKAASEKAKPILGQTSGELDVDALKKKMFEAFEISDKQLFKDILSYCSSVPGFTKEKDLRDLLETYAKYSSRGQFKHFWELKPEYRDHSLQQKEINK